MAHEVVKSGFTALVDRLNRFPQGAPPSETLYKFLNILFSEKEARLVALLPGKPFTARQAAEIWKVSRAEAQNILDGLAARAILVDSQYEGQTYATAAIRCSIWIAPVMRPWTSA